MIGSGSMVKSFSISPMTAFQSDLLTNFWMASISFGLSEGLTAGPFCACAATGCDGGAGDGAAGAGALGDGGAWVGAAGRGGSGERGGSAARCGASFRSMVIVSAGSGVFWADCTFWLVPCWRASEYCCRTCKMRGLRLIRSARLSSVTSRMTASSAVSTVASAACW